MRCSGHVGGRSLADFPGACTTGCGGTRCGGMVRAFGAERLGIGLALMMLLVVLPCCKTRKDVTTPRPASVSEATASDGGGTSVERGAGPGTEPLAPVAAGSPRAACSAYAEPVVVGRLQSDALNEVSGIAASRTRPGALFVHNDSGDSARVFAIDTAGAVLLEMDLPVADVTDCEDIAAGPGPDGPSVFLGDIGDNAARDGRGKPRKSVVVYRFAEPPQLVHARGGRMRIPRVDALRFGYPDHPHDGETLLVDPASGDLFVVTKEEDGNSGVYRAGAPLVPGARVLERVASIAFTPRVLGAQLATGGDFSPLGDAIVVRTYSSAFQWSRAPGQSVAAALAGPRRAVPIAVEVQGEALGFAADGSGYFTTSEHTGQPIYFVRCRP